MKRMTARGQSQALILTTKRKGDGKCKSEIQGSVRLRCSQNAVSNFAQDDVWFFRDEENSKKDKGRSKGDDKDEIRGSFTSFKMTTLLS